MRISDWSSDVCSSDLNDVKLVDGGRKKWELESRELTQDIPERTPTTYTAQELDSSKRANRDDVVAAIGTQNLVDVRSPDEYAGRLLAPAHLPQERSEEHTSELQSLMRISYAVFCLKTKTHQN